MTPQIVAKLRVVPMIIVMGTIFFLSHQPADKLSLPMFYGSDKLAHLIAYGTLAATVYLALSPQYRNRYAIKSILITILVSLAYGLSDEFHQSFIPSRDVSLGDVLADLFGAVLGVCLFHYTLQRLAGASFAGSAAKEK